MTKNIRKWIIKNIKGYKFDRTIDGRDMVFVPASQAALIIKYLDRVKANCIIKWAASYTWLVIIFQS